jgi:hypothetical protein
MVLIAYDDNRKVRLTPLGKATKCFNKRKKSTNDEDMMMVVASKIIFNGGDPTLDNIKDCARGIDWMIDDQTALIIYFMIKEFNVGFGDNI